MIDFGTNIYDALIEELGDPIVRPAIDRSYAACEALASEEKPVETPELSEVAAAIETVQSAGLATEGMANLLELVREADVAATEVVEATPAPAES